MNDLLLVIDMQNVYLPDQPWACETAARTKENILKLLENHPKDQTIFTRYIAAEHPVGTWKTYNELNRKINENPWMNELMDGIKEAAESYPVYDKSTYSSFQVPTIRKAAQKADRVILTGRRFRVLCPFHFLRRHRPRLQTHLAHRRHIRPESGPGGGNFAYFTGIVTTACGIFKYRGLSVKQIIVTFAE